MNKINATATVFILLPSCVNWIEIRHCFSRYPPHHPHQCTHQYPHPYHNHQPWLLVEELDPNFHIVVFNQASPVELDDTYFRQNGYVPGKDFAFRIALLSNSFIEVKIIHTPLIELFNQLPIQIKDSLIPITDSITYKMIDDNDINNTVSGLDEMNKSCSPRQMEDSDHGLIDGVMITNITVTDKDLWTLLEEQLWEFKQDHDEVILFTLFQGMIGSSVRNAYPAYIPLSPFEWNSVREDHVGAMIVMTKVNSSVADSLISDIRSFLE